MPTDLSEKVRSMLPGSTTSSDQVDPSLVWLVKQLDNAFTIPGTNMKIGWDGVIGLIPGVGDLSTALFASWMLKEAQRVGVPLHKRMLIGFHYGVDFLIGLVPVVGDIFDFGYKANAKSLEIIEHHLNKSRNPDQ